MNPLTESYPLALVSTRGFSCSCFSVGHSLVLPCICQGKCLSQRHTISELADVIFTLLPTFSLSVRLGQRIEPRSFRKFDLLYLFLKLQAQCVHVEEESVVAHFHIFIHFTSCDICLCCFITIK